MHSLCPTDRANIYKSLWSPSTWALFGHRLGRNYGPRLGLNFGPQLRISFGPPFAKGDSWYSRVRRERSWLWRMAPLAAFPLLPHSLPHPSRIFYQNESLISLQRNPLVSTIPFSPGLRLPSHHRNSNAASAIAGSLSASLRASKLRSNNNPVNHFLINIRDSKKAWFSSGSTCGAVDRIACSARARSRASPIAARVAKSAYSSRRVLPFRALLALSAAAAVIFLRRSVSFHLFHLIKNWGCIRYTCLK